MLYRAGSTDTVFQGNTYSSVPKTVTQYTTAQYTSNNIPAGQYQPIVPTSGQRNEQYGPQTNQYSTGIKSSIPQNRYQAAEQFPSWGSDVSRQMTVSGDVTSTSYVKDLQSPASKAYQNNANENYFQNGQATNGYNPALYAKTNVAGMPTSQQNTSPYATQSAAPEYGPSYAYTVGSGLGSNFVRGNIPKPKSPRVKHNSRKTQNKVQILQNLRTVQGLIHGPSPNKNNKLSRVNKLDKSGQYPTDTKGYNNVAQGAGISSPSYAGVTQRAYTRNGNRWSTRTQTPGTWNPGRDAKTGSYDSWSLGMQTQKPGSRWISGSGAKVDEAVKYNNDETMSMSQTTDANKAMTKNINMDNVVNKALTDFLTAHVLRKKKRRKRENDLTHANVGTNEARYTKRDNET